jgi:UDP:flavonoid glycosyltransferase YjiC (YdhE family)
VGESVPVAWMNKEDLSGAIQEVLGDPSYRDTARRFQRTIAQTHGLDRAADVLERAFQLIDETGVAVWETSNSSARRSNN